jgi:hypothetical protein
MVHEYYIYITGDTGRTVQISYPEREKAKNTSKDMLMDGSPAPEYTYGDDNTTITESITLPFFKEVHAIADGKKFLEVTSENDTTTKAAIFINNVCFPDTCPVILVFFPENGKNYNKCAYCRDLPCDSVLNYLKKISYSYYLEFSQGDTRKRVSR